MKDPGVYWVKFSEEYRAVTDKIHADCRLNRVEWPTKAFIAEWGSRVCNPTESDYVWLTLGDELTYDEGELVIVSGPLEAPSLS